MRDDFEKVIKELNARNIGIEVVSSDFYQVPDNRGFVKSPVTTDSTRSCKLYPSTNTFCDFANGNFGGDVIAFVAYAQGINNWESMKLLSGYYCLTDPVNHHKDDWHKTILRRQEDRRRAERQNVFHKALFALISDLKVQEDNSKAILNKAEIEPFSDLWIYFVNELQRISYKLDILTGADQHTYRRMKSNNGLGLSSDRPQWLLDTLDILAETGYFTATSAELSEIKAQRDFELKRKPGADRRCCVTW